MPVKLTPKGDCLASKDHGNAGVGHSAPARASICRMSGVASNHWGTLVFSNRNELYMSQVALRIRGESECLANRSYWSQAHTLFRRKCACFCQNETHAALHASTGGGCVRAATRTRRYSS